MTKRLAAAALTVIAAAGLAALVSPARADAIDGDWCADDGRHLAIKGPAITTPGGARIEGNYTRHSFTYVVPEGEAGAGQPVAMIQLNETTIELKADPEGQTETWLRCKPAIS